MLISSWTKTSQVDNRLKPWLLEINPGGGLLTGIDKKKKPLQSVVTEAWDIIIPKVRTSLFAMPMQ